ncbi:hypothetical protein N7493_008748 [Penicillium malachiteum]|uniref:Zn(2)-C6 fungal-type domain-containing protein n=1 Tax=Penicillium malachiteum TaxID=1324776 RepID=A0AAD6MSR1_9EURO|nr:hypothetical protein N7493_008748 [Penicillium malachiteum]
MEVMPRRPSRVEKSRPAKACNTCRRKKVKCDGKRPTCSSCMIFNLPCGFEDAGKNSSRTRKTYVEELEQRIKDMEDQLQQLRQSEKSPRQTTQDCQSPGIAASPIRNDRVDHAEPRAEGHILPGSKSPDDEVPQSERETCNPPSYFLRMHDGKMRFFGASAGLDVHNSEEANRRMPKKSNVGWECVARRSASKWPLTNWIPRILQDSFEYRTTLPLPPREATLTLVTEFLTNFNHTVPLVDDTSLRRLVEKQFSWNPDDSPSSWVLLNVVIAFSYRERAQASFDASGDWQRSLGHVRNALNVLVDLFMCNADLAAVQGLLGLALYFQGTPNAQAQFMLAASAMRLSHSIGLHRNATSGFTPAEIEERRRTFWISFILDAEISLRVGRPPVQDMEDYNTPLPAKSPHDGRGIISINGISINFFRLLAEFATLQRRTYRCIVSAVMSRQSKETALKSAQACEEGLLSWRSSIPDSFRAEHVFASKPNHFNKHLLRLQLAYHSCYANLRQFSILTSPFLTKNPQEPPTDVDKDIKELCLRAIDSARSALSLLPYIRLLVSNCRWNVLYFFSAACVTLSSEIRSHSTHQRSKDDLALIHEATAFLMDVSDEEPGTFIDFILDVCSDIEDSARRGIQQVRSDNDQPPSQGANEGIADMNIDLGGRQRPANNSDNSFLNSEVDLLNDVNLNYINTQWQIPPLWNWQDILGMPLSPDPNRGRTD